MVKSEERADLVIIGGGIMGLWAAWYAQDAGIDTLLVDKGLVGCGASNGLLGVLMAYMPDQWDAKKQFQFEALTELEPLVGDLESKTGVNAGYRRSGRIMPLYNERHLKTAYIREQEAKTNWCDNERRFRWNVVEKSPIEGWPAPNDAVLAYVEEDLAAHIFPRGLVSALTAFLKTASHVRIRECAAVTEVQHAENRLRFADGSFIKFGKVIVAAGVEAFSLLQPLWVSEGKSLGRAVKGQAALLAADCDPALPVLYNDGLYVVAHEGGRVAVGSTSEDDFDAPFETDIHLDRLIEAARKAVPALQNAPVVERWAGLRPRGVHREPMIGSIADMPDVIALGGGFKTSFGVAHKLARHAVRLAQDALAAEDILPEIFDLNIYLRRAK